MRCFSIPVNDLEFENRLVPTYYYYTHIIKDKNIDNGIKYLNLGQESTISDGEHSAIPRNDKGGIRYLYGRNIKEGIIDFDPVSDDSYISNIDYDSFKRCHINQNDVLIAIYGTVGKSAVYKEEYVGVAGIPRHIANISIKNNSELTPQYLTAFFRSKFGKWQIDSVTTGNIQQLLSLKNLREFEVPIVSKELLSKITENESKALSYEIEAKKKIDKAKRIFLDGLNFDIKSITGDMAFTVKFSELEANNIWSASLYDKLYVKIGNALLAYNNAISLGEIADCKHGDEVGSEQYKTFVERSDSDYAFIRTSDIVNHEVDLYPDYYVEENVYNEIAQDIKEKDILFTKDGKIGCTGMLTDADKVIISSGIERIRLNKYGLETGLTQEYLFLALAFTEVGLYGAKRRTVVASTIPHLREERLKEIEIPLMDKDYISEISELIEEAFFFKSKRKRLLKDNENLIDNYFLK